MKVKKNLVSCLLAIITCGGVTSVEAQNPVVGDYG